MFPKKSILLLFAAIILFGGCTNTRYLTDPVSTDRQHDMRKHRTGVNTGDVLLSLANFFISQTFDSNYEINASERAFKRITLYNESTDSLYINMVTDIVWKETGYCDIMGIALPPGSKQKLLVPYPAAYNVYFRTPASEEEKLEVRTDNKHRVIKLRPGMTGWLNGK